MTYYAGIGSRKTPQEVLNLMTRIAQYMKDIGWTLRSGGALGADKAFEIGAGQTKEIFTANDFIPQKAFDTVPKYHPAPYALSDFATRLMARNAMQIFGKEMDQPVKLVMCWTPDGANGTSIPTTRNTGGTGQAIRIAADNGIRVLNLGNEDTMKRVLSKLPKKYT